MSNQASVTVILANRPRLFRELLQHALKTESPNIRVMEASDGTPSAALLREANWLVVDEESAAEATHLAAANPDLGILALETRGSRARLIGPRQSGLDQSFFDVPTLAGLFSLLSHPAVEPVQ
jgi:DNA-binding NarL/FixJ family response regulator